MKISYFFILVFLVSLSSTAFAQEIFTFNENETVDDAKILSNTPDDSLGLSDLAVEFTSSVNGDFLVRFQMKSYYDSGIQSIEGYNSSQPLTNATLYLSQDSNTLDAGEHIDVRIFQVFPFPTYNISDQPWQEGNEVSAPAPQLTWNRRPSGSSFNSTIYQQYNISSAEANDIKQFDVTDLLNRVILSGEENITLWFSPFNFISADGNLVRYKSTETEPTEGPSLVLNSSGNFENISSNCKVDSFHLFNLSLLDEQNTTKELENFTIDVTIELVNTSISEIPGSNYSFTMNDATGLNICSKISEKDLSNYTINAFFDYIADGYDQRQYYIENGVANVSTALDFYSILSTESSVVKITVTDLSNSPLSSVLVFIQRYYVNENMYRTVSMLRTDSLGKDQTTLEGSDVFYRFVIVQNGVNIGTLTPSKIPIDPVTLEADITLTVDPGNIGQLYELLAQLSFSCSYNNVTNTSTCSYADSSGLVSLAEQTVIQQTVSDRNSICAFNNTNSSGVFICYLGNASGVYSVQLLVELDKNTKYILISDVIEINNPTNAYGNIGLLVTLFMILVSALIFRFNPAVSVLGAFSTLAVVWIFGLIQVPATAIIALMVVCMIVLYYMRT